MRIFSSVSAFILAALVTGCTSHVADKQQYSGFLGDYSQLQPTQSPSGKPTLRWISPDYHRADYSNVVFDPVIYYPAAHPSGRVSQQTLEQIRQYTNNQLKQAVAARKPLVTQPGAHTLHVKSAITAVTAENEGMQFYEVVPVAAVVASTMAATGHRTQNSELFLEVDVSDAQTGKPLIKVVRKAFGKSLPNSTTPITLNDVRPGIDQMVQDVVAFSSP